MKKILLLIFLSCFLNKSFSQKDSILYTINFFYQGTTYTSIQIARYDTGFNLISSVINIPTCNWGCGVDYTAFDRQHNLIYVNYFTLYAINPKTGFYYNVARNNLGNYAFNCRDSTMYAANATYSASTYFFNLAKIYPIQDTIILSPAGPFYSGKSIKSPTIDEKNNKYCFLDSLYRIVSVDLKTAQVTGITIMSLSNGQTCYGLKYNPNDSLLYTILTDSISNKAFLRSINVNTGSVFTFSSDINATGFLPANGNVNQNVDIDYFNNTFYFSQCDCNITNPGKNVVFNKVDIKTGQLLKSSHVTTYSKHSYIGFVYGQLTDCVFTGVNEFQTIGSELLDSIRQIGLMPNPSYNTIYLTNLTDNFTSSIVDNLGRLIFQKIVNATDNSLDISTLSEGIYYLKLSAKDSSCKIFKVIKQ